MKSEFGVPQGTVLSPKLFSIYTNKISLISSGKVFTFADDTLLVYIGNNWEGLHDQASLDLNKIHRWFKTMSLHINTNKTSYMTISLNNSGQPTHSQITIHTCQSQSTCTCNALKQVDRFRYLGLEIDKHFTWKDHILKIKVKLRRLFHVFVNLRRILNLNYLKMLYYAFVQSILQYGVVGWGSAYDTHLIPLQRTQNILLRIIMKTHRRYSTRQLYLDFDTFNITQLYIHKVLYFINKRNIYDTITRTQQRTRQQGSAAIIRVKKEFVRKHFIRITPMLINALPTTLTHIPSLMLKKVLKPSLKSFFSTSEYTDKILSIFQK
ncbi:hypothetical protein WDU94_008920 [Cyamophila willieti]